MNGDAVRYRATGRVKWFDAVKGFGFVVPDEGEGDVLLHGNVLRNYGQSSVAEGAAVEFMAQTTQRGVQAVEVLSVEAPECGQTGTGFEDWPQHELTHHPLEPARVKWFDKGKGFGFANVFGRAEDVFVHVEVVRRSGLADLQPGEAVGLRVIEGKRGRMAMQVATWDVAASVAETEA